MEKKILDVAVVAEGFRNDLLRDLDSGLVKPRLTTFLCSADPGCVRYAKVTQKKCSELGVRVDLRKCEPEELECQIAAANVDPDVHGIMVYYPVFGIHEKDEKLRNTVFPNKDVEGLNDVHRNNIYNNIRNFAGADRGPTILPITPLSIVKILEYIKVHKGDYPNGDALKGKTITVINRSEVVGRPLAAMLSNDGAKVYSVDIGDILELDPPEVLGVGSFKSKLSEKTLEEALAISDVVISGVPTASYKISTKSLKPGIVAINFSHFNNYQDDITDVASIFVPSIGKVTVTMLQRNLLKIYNYSNGYSQPPANGVNGHHKKKTNCTGN